MGKKWHANWEGFVPGCWSNAAIDVRDFIQANYTPYDGDDSFLAGAGSGVLGSNTGKLM